MMKLIGMILVVAAGTAIGFKEKYRYKNTVVLLEIYLAFIQEAKISLKLSMCSVDEFIQSMSTNMSYQKLEFIRFCLCSNSVTFSEAYSTAVNQWCDLKQIKDRNVREAFLAFGNIFGRCDMNSQQEQFSTLGKEITRLIMIYREQTNSKGKLCQSLGTLMGIGLALLFV